MKKIRFFALLLPLFLLISCDKEQEDIPGGNVRISVEVSVDDVFRNLKDITGNPCFTGRMPGDYRLRVAVFLYKSENAGAYRLSNHRLVFTDQPQAGVSFRLDSGPGEFFVFATVDVVRLKDGELLHNYNDVVVHTRQPSIEIRYKNQGGCNNAAGFTVSQKFGLHRSGEKADVRLKTRPVGSLATFCFRNAGSGTMYRYFLPGVYRHLISYSPDEDAVRADISGEWTAEAFSVPSADHPYRVQRYLVTPGDSATICWEDGNGGEHRFGFGLIPGGINHVDIDLARNQAMVSH